MITCFVQLNLKLLFVLILLGFIIGKSRHSAIQNFSNKKCGYFIMDFFNLIGIPRSRAWTFTLWTFLWIPY